MPAIIHSTYHYETAAAPEEITLAIGQYWRNHRVYGNLQIKIQHK